jgi:hypothetical protein
MDRDNIFSIRDAQQEEKEKPEPIQASLEEARRLLDEAQLCLTTAYEALGTHQVYEIGIIRDLIASLGDHDEVLQELIERTTQD